MADPISIGLAAVSIGSKLFGFGKKKKAARRQRQARELQQRIAEISNARKRRDAIRQARISRANVIAAGVASGGGLDSSAVQGAEQSIFSQIESNLQFADTTTGLSRRAASLDEQAAKALSQANLFDAVSNVTGQFASATGGFDAIGAGLLDIGGTIFGGGPQAVASSTQTTLPQPGVGFG